ncbi:MAG: hypothetical protein M3Q82_01665, partial [Actinomycetota bacterium]|nr:hypothetical protein [Actinomycetota bacterium]
MSTRYVETLATLAVMAELKAAAVFARWESGELDDEEFVALAETILWRECARGVALAFALSVKSVCGRVWVAGQACG